MSVYYYKLARGGRIGFYIRNSRKNKEFWKENTFFTDILLNIRGFEGKKGGPVGFQQ